MSDSAPGHSASRRGGIVLAVLGALWGGSAGDADDTTPTGTSYRIIDDRFATTTGDPIELDGDRAMVFDHDAGLPRAVPTSSVLGIAAGPVAERELTLALRNAIRRAGDDRPLVAPYLELVDGQRIPGGVVADGSGRPVWRSAWIRDLPFELERIRAVRFEPGARVATAEDEDVVVLANGDELRGLVDRIGLDVAIEVEGPDGPRTIEVLLSRVGSISLVNPVETVDSALTWLRGGHRIASRSVQVDDGYVRLVRPLLGGDVAEIPLEFLLAIAPQADRIQPLASMPLEVSSAPESVRRPWIPPPTLGVGHHPFDASAIRLDGPLSARFTLPNGPSDVIGLFERPAESGPGRLLLVVRDGDREIDRLELDGSRPLSPFSYRIESGRLVLDVEEAGDGPFHDSVLIREGLVVRPGS